ETVAGDFYDDIAIDDVSFVEAPNCPNPSSLATSNITATSADLAWIAGDSEIAWDIELVDISASGSATGTPTTENINTNPYTLTGLLAQNDYEIYLRADCGRSEVSDWLGPVSFTTSCAPISTFPVTTDFTLNPPTSCWTQAADGDPTSGPTGLGGSEWSAGRSYNSIPSNRVNLFNLGSAEWLISPTYDIPALIAHELIINVAVTGYNSASAGAMGSDDEVQLLQTTDAGVTWTNITTWNAANQPSELGTSFTADLTSLSGSVQFAIWGSEGLVDDSEDFDFHVGAFTVREVPSCLEPTDLTATGQTLTTIDLAWTAGGTESLWNIEIYEQGADTSTATPVYTQTNATTTSTTATGLSLGDYTAYVQANCGGTDGVSPAASINFSIDYCTSTPSSNDVLGITNVQLGSTDFPTGDVTYADYRDTVVDLELDNTANLQVSFATGYTYGTNVWIDFNDDLVFDTTELVFTGTSQSTNPTTLDASFDIAVDAAQGTHYMRIGTADNGQATPNPCYSGAFGVTIDMAVNVIIPGSCNDLTIWDGTVWSNGAPTTNSYAHIGAAYATVTNGDIDACSLAINAATTVDALGYVNIDGDINVKSAGSLTVAHTGSVVQVQETATTTNGGAISVLVDTPTLDILDFMVMGSPMSAETREGVWSTAWNVQDHTTANFNSIDGIIGFNFLDEELDDWNLSTGVLSAGEGYLVRPQDSYNGAGGVFNYDFNTGTLNSGVVTQTLGFNATDLESPNMLSNPYASAIDADLFLAANPQFDALYFWEHNLAPSTTYPGANSVGNNYSMDDVSYYNALGGTAATSGGAAPNGAIATGQGFGVFATAGGTATFNNAMRLTSGNTTLRNNNISRDRLWLNVNSTVYNVSGNTLLGFVADATQGVDRKYDNGRVASKVSLYSHIQGSDRGYSIQGREAFENGMTVALGFSSIIEEVTSYKISLSDFDGEAWLEATPYLVDNQTGVVTNLMEDDYNFTSDMGEFNDRFEIIFQDRSLGSQESLASSIAMYPNPASDVVTIASPTAAITMVAVRDIRGRLILNKAVTSQNVTTINVASLDSALYLVTITTDSGSITSRLIIE
ncbi:T9SS type A sorting domain-containing protein, partial [Flavobacteriaceae bacterium]|nr:T9SS type A sorting domain-containing protein [Flavobacteriaceae bacterium]